MARKRHLVIDSTEDRAGYRPLCNTRGYIGFTTRIETKVSCEKCLAKIKERRSKGR